MNRCLYCYEPVDDRSTFHSKCSRAFFGTPEPPVLDYSLDQMSELAKKVVQSSISVPGVQPKLSMTILRNELQKDGVRLTVVDALGGNYIFKPPSIHYREMPENEHLTMRIAQAYGLNVVPSSLIPLASGELAYITKRVDRTREGEKIHMLDMFQITEAFDKYRSSHEKVGKAIHSYSANTLLDKLFYFELTLFCFLTGNNDMHLKNFSMLQGNSGWILAPAYDLLNVAIILPEDQEELALSLGGNKKRLGKKLFATLGQTLGLTEKQIRGVFSRMLANKPLAIGWIERSFLSTEMKSAYKDLLESRYKQLNL